MVVIVPITSKIRRLRYRVLIFSPDGGLIENSDAICDQPRSVSTGRFGSFMGAISEHTMIEVEVRLRALLALPVRS